MYASVYVVTEVSAQLQQPAHPCGRRSYGQRLLIPVPGDSEAMRMLTLRSKPRLLMTAHGGLEVIGR